MHCNIGKKYAHHAPMKSRKFESKKNTGSKKIQIPKEQSIGEVGFKYSIINLKTNKPMEDPNDGRGIPDYTRDAYDYIPDEEK